MKKWFKKIELWSLKNADTKWGSWALFFCAFLDASIFGIPTPMLFLALALMNIKKVWEYTIFGIFGTLAGAVAGYAIGHFAWLTSDGGYSGVAQFMFNNIPGFSVAGYEKIHLLYEKWDFWVLFAAAALPVPFKIFSISSGVFDINLVIFCIATFISQGLKFLILAILTLKLGPQVKKLFEYNWKPVIIIVTAGIAIAIVLIKIF